MAFTIVVLKMKTQETLTKHVEKKPVSHMAFLDNCVDDFSSYQSESDVEQVRPHLGTNDDNDPIEDDQNAEHWQQDEPEPEEDVHLLIDNVER